MALEDRRKKAIEWAFGIAAGHIPPELVSKQFKAWTAFSGDVEHDEYFKRVAVIGQVFPDKLQFTLDRSIAEGNAVSLQVRGKGTLFNGKEYTQSYIFIVEFDEEEKIRHLREYIDTHIVHEMLFPAMVEWREENGV